MEQNVYSILLAGGSGTRLWPVSRELYPKQLVRFIGSDTLIQSTIRRLSPVLDTACTRVVCGKEHVFQISRQMEAMGMDPGGRILCEPCGRNTAPAILLALLDVLRDHPDPVVCVFPADHVIRDIGAFHDRIAAAVRLARQGYIVTFGIRPLYPETGYGYIEGAHSVGQGAFEIRRFVEKPDLPTARSYVQAGNFYWNSGMFAFRAQVMVGEFARLQPEMLDAMRAMTSGHRQPPPEMYEKLENISIDYAIMEHTRKGVVLPSDFGWSDIGSWKSLHDFIPKDADGNVFEGDVLARDVRDSIVMGYNRLIAVNAISDMVVVETPDAVFVSGMDDSREVKSIVERLKSSGREESQRHGTVHHPWGLSTRLMRDSTAVVERLVLQPGAGMQAGGTDAVHLIVVEGEATIGPDARRVGPGQSLATKPGTQVEIFNERHVPATIVRVKVLAGSQ